MSDGMKATAFLLLAVATTSAAQAQQFTIAGYGGAACSQLSVVSGQGWRASESAKAAVSWSQGFITGVSLLSASMHQKNISQKETSPDKIWGYIASECLANPDETLQTVADKYFAAFAR